MKTLMTRDRCIEVLNHTSDNIIKSLDGRCNIIIETLKNSGFKDHYELAGISNNNIATLAYTPPGTANMPNLPPVALTCSNQVYLHCVIYWMTSHCHNNGRINHTYKDWVVITQDQVNFI